MKDQKVEEEMLTSLEADLVSLKRKFACNQQILNRVREGDICGWPELAGALAAGVTIEELTAAMEKQLAEEAETIARGDTEIKRLRALHRGGLASKPGRA